MSLSEGNVALQRCTTTFKVTVFRSRKTKQVLFVEAGKDFVDTLLNFLVLPVATFIHVLSQGGDQYTHSLDFGGISSIFESAKELDSSFHHVDKQNLVQPRPAAAGCTCTSGKSMGMLRQGLEAANIIQSPPPKRLVLSTKEYYKCYYCSFLSSVKGARCDKCSTKQRNITFCDGPFYVHENIYEEVNPPTGTGFVKESFSFIVTDKLEIMPSNANRIIDVLNKLDVATVADLESNDLTVSISQIVQLLRLALTSNTCLNEVFGMKK